MSTLAALQKRQHDESAPQKAGPGKSVRAAGVGLPLFMQTKLAIGASDDPLEQEADRVADEVLARSSNPAVSGVSTRIQRYTGPATGATGTAPASVDRVLANSGKPLDSTLQQDMGQRFGHDFSGVRVHSGSEAEQSAQDMHAHAYTVGPNVVFGRGAYAPHTSKGYHLLAHELTHVVQQSQGDASLIQRLPLDFYSDTDPLHDPSRLTDREIEATDEYKRYMAMPAPPDPDMCVQGVFPDEALLACRLILRDMRDQGNCMSPTDDELLFWLERARSRLASTTTAEGAVGTLKWVAASATDVQSPSTAASEFTRWMLAAGNKPDPATGQLNCWEMVLFSAYRAGHLSEATMRGIYTRAKAAMSGSGGAMAFPRTLERALRSSNEYIYNPADPNTPRPLRGDLVIFKEAAAHVALATGRQVGGQIEIVSHWPPPNGDHHVKITTIELLLPRVGVTVAKFWSPIW